MRSQNNHPFSQVTLSRTLGAMPGSSEKKNQEKADLLQPLSILCFAFVLLTSFFTYFYRYNSPQAPFWDENYYITDAQRILNGVYFMQIHPPLGKLLIAAGEALVNGNDSDAQFLDTEHAGEFPKDFSFAGYRLFPALLGWLGAVIFFACFLLLTRSPLLSTLLSFLYVFDNALIVHSRGAMLDAPLNFFVLLTILAFLLLVRTKNRKRPFLWLSAFLGISLGLTITTKMNGLFLILLIPALCFHFRKERNNGFASLGVAFASFLIIFGSVWYIHLSRMELIRPELRDEGWYLASEEYKQILTEGRQRSLFSLPLMIRDHLKYAPHYNKGIPKLDLCKPDENGSPVFLWPIGATTINYRWASAGEGVYRYLYLIPNPVSWFLGLAGVILSAAFLIAPLFYSTPRSREHREQRFLGLTFFALYGGYMAAFLMMDRVHFLYSYFPALLVSFLLLGIVVAEMQSLGSWKFSEERKTLLAMFFSCLIFLGFQIYRPFTYYEPISNDALQRRAIFRLWNMRCVGCEKPSPLVRRQCDA